MSSQAGDELRAETRPQDDRSTKCNTRIEYDRHPPAQWPPTSGQGSIGIEVDLIDEGFENAARNHLLHVARGERDQVRWSRSRRQCGEDSSAVGEDLVRGEGMYG